MGETLQIAHVTFHREYDVSIIFFCADVDCDGFRLELSRADDFDDQDYEGEMDTYCLCTDMGHTWYGGIRKIVIETGRIDFELLDEAADALGIPKEFSFETAVPPDLRRWLESICPEVDVSLGHG